MYCRRLVLIVLSDRGQFPRSDLPLNILMKTINSVADLAINGAEPLFSEYLHVGQPTMGSKEKFLDYVDGIFERDWFTNDGVLVQTLEREIAELHRVEHCVAICNGTAALEIATRALGLSGEVIVPSFTFVATAHALQWQGIKPVFADIDQTTHCLDPDSVAEKISSATTAILGVHLWGNPCEVEKLDQLAKESGLKLLFDAAHAFGVKRNGVSIGSFGSCEILSFHATKLFNTFEGGAVLTNDQALADKVRLMRNFGFSGLDNVVYAGVNGKMNEVSAAMGLTNLVSIDSLIELNRMKHAHYERELAEISGVKFLISPEGVESNYQYAVLQVGQEFPVSRDELVEVLHQENVRVRRYFWPGCHRMVPYRSNGSVDHSELPITDLVADSVVVLPMGHSVTADVIRAIASVIKAISYNGSIS